MKNSRWDVIKFCGVLGLQKEESAVKLFEYSVLETHESVEEAYRRMKELAEEMNIPSMKYNSLEK